MTNKEIVEKLRDNAELAMASYGYFHYFLEQQSKSYFLVMQDRQGNEIRDADNKLKIQEIYITDILNANYKNHRVVEFVQLGKEQKEITIGKLNGDFGKEQAKQFFSRYDLLKHCSNTDSGFSATLFGEKRKQINSKTKEKSYTSEYGYINYILALRGTEMSSFKDLFIADASLAVGSIPKAQYDDMINFYETCIKDYPQIKEKDSLVITGHSLGGCLAQLLALSLCDDKNEANINEVYMLYNNTESKPIKELQCYF